MSSSASSLCIADNPPETPVSYGIKLLQLKIQSHMVTGE